MLAQRTSTVPERVGHYELLTEVTRGVDAALWIARASDGADVGRLVMVRRIPRDLVDTESLVRLERAVSAATQVREPNILAVLDLVVGPRDVAVVSEYVEGEMLRSLQRAAAQKGSALPIPVAMRIAHDLLTSIRSASDRVRSLSSGTPSGSPPASLHGCVSSDCVLIASFGDTMLTDLGVAGIRATVMPLVFHPTALPYAPPERFEPAADLDDQADVFSVGVLLWELIANRSLFGEGRSLRDPSHPGPLGRSTVVPREAIDERMYKPIPRLDSIRRPGSPVPPKVAELVARAVERDRGARFQSVEEMTRAIFALEGMLATPYEVASALDRLARCGAPVRRADR